MYLSSSMASVKLNMVKFLSILLLTCSIISGNPVKSDKPLNFVTNTKDINGNGLNDVLCFLGENFHRTAIIFDIDKTELSNIWEYSLPENRSAYFTDAVLADLSGDGDSELLLIGSQKNNSFILYIFSSENISQNNAITAQLPPAYSKLRNPNQSISLDWDNDGDLELAVSFTSPNRTVLICDFENGELIVLDELGKDFLPNNFGPIMISAGDLNGDNKDDVVIIDNGLQAKARIYMNGEPDIGIRILGLKDVGHLSYLNPTGVDFDGNGGSEIFCTSANSGLHYIFVETIGTTNQAVTVKTKLIVESVDHLYTIKNENQSQIITIHPDGKVGRYSIVSTDGDLSTGIFEITDSTFSFESLKNISSIYFPDSRELIISGENNSNNELFFLSHNSYIEPEIDFASQRTDKRNPDYFLEANKTENIPLTWVDSLTFVEFMSSNLSEGMSFSDDGKLIQWMPTLNQLGFHEINYTGHFRNLGDLSITQEDSVQTIKLEEELINISDSLLIYVNDPPAFSENKNQYITVSGELFSQKFSVQDRNVDAQLTFYFTDSDTSGITVSDTGLVQWTPGKEIIGKNQFRLFVSDGIQKDSIDFIIQVHPAIEFNNTDSTFIIQPGNLFTASFKPAPAYHFNEYRYTLKDAPENMHVDINGNITWTPIPSQVDSHNFTLVVEDGITSVEQIISVYVNSPPIIFSNPPSITYLNTNENFHFSLKSFDANEDTELSWYLLDGPEGMWLDSTGVLTWDPKILNFAEYKIQLSDGYNMTEFSGSVYINFTPVFTSKPPKLINFGDTLTLALKAVDENTLSPFDNTKKNTIQYLILEGSPTAEIKSDNILYWVPGEKEIGLNKIIIAATDGIARVKQTMEIMVNHIPVITSVDSISVEAGENLLHILTALDENSDNISFELADTSFTISLIEDTIKWSTDNSNLGKHVITIQASDGFENSNSKQELLLFVYKNPEFTNQAPTEAFVGVEYTFIPEVSFMGTENSIKFINGTSDKMRFNEDGNFVWIPDSEDVGIQQMTMVASDSNGLTSKITYTVGVKNNPIVEESVKPKQEPSSPVPKESPQTDEKIQQPSEE